MRDFETATRDALARKDVPQIAAALLDRLRTRSPRVAWRATEALTMIGVAGELAARNADGPGSFAVAIVDALYTLNGPTLIVRAKVN